MALEAIVRRLGGTAPPNLHDELRKAGIDPSQLR
jgi:hypothetical protein